MIGQGTRLFLLGAFVITGLFGGWMYSRKQNEKELLKSKEYSDAVKDWEKIQAWFVRDYKGKFKSFSLLLDTGGVCAFDILVSTDDDGKLKFPVEDLSPSEFILAVSMIKDHFKDDYYG